MNARGLVKKVKDVYRPFSEHFFELIGGHFKIENKMPKWLNYEIIKKGIKDVIGIVKDAKGLKEKEKEDD